MSNHSNRAARRSAAKQHRVAISGYRARAGRTLITYLVDVDDLPPAPLLRAAGEFWLDGLARASPQRRCIVCDMPFADRRDVGGVLLSHPARAARLASVSGVCHACFAGDLAAIERAVEKLLGQIVIGGVLESMHIEW